MSNSVNKVKDIFRKMSYILTREQKIYGFLVIILSFAAAGFELLGVSVIVPLVNTLLEPQKLVEDKGLGVLLEKLRIKEDSQIIAAVIIFVIFVYIIKNLFFSFNTWVRLKYSCKIQRECSVRMFSSYLNRGYTFFLNHNENEMLQGAIGDISGLYAMISLILQLITQVTIIILIVIYMLYSDWRLALSVIIAAVLCLAVISTLLRKKMSEAGLGIRKYAILLNKVLLEAFNGIKEVLVMQRKDYYIKKYEKDITRKQKYQIVQGIGGEVPAYMIETICIVGIMLILSIRINSIEDREAFVAVLAAFAMSAFRVLPALGKVSSALNGITSYIPNLDAIYDNIVIASGQEKNIAEIVIENKKDFDINAEFEHIHIDHISFGYDINELGLVLDDVDIDIHRGESVAFIGETGAGKSTLADIILGLLDPTEGSVDLDGRDIRTIPSTWADIVAFVPQSIYLSDNSIKKNVAFGVEDKDIDNERVLKALKDANVLSFVETLPEGIDTEIGDRGVRLSGGQCQRLGIARALYRNPKILILDEATSALDNDTERAVMDAIEGLQGRMTMIIIAHRLTTIRKCDSIYEIKGRKIYKRKYEEL